MDISVETLSEYRTATGQDLLLGPGATSLASFGPGACTTCFWSSCCTTTCGVVVVDTE